MNTGVKVAVGGTVVLVVGIAALFILKKFKKSSVPEAIQTTNPIAETQSTETVSNVVSNIIDKTVQTVGVGVPRGIRNNNPLNIKWNASNNWNGQTGKDSGGFCIFDNPENGVRAAAKILNSYKRMGLTTIRQIVTRWTSGDSTTIQSNYINFIVKGLQIGADVPLNSNNYAALLFAMTQFENGKNPYPMSMYVSGVNSAGV
jgi:hypothetical protein